MCGSANTFEWHEELDSHYEDDPEVFQGYKKVTKEAKQHGRPTQFIAAPSKRQSSTVVRAYVTQTQTQKRPSAFWV